MGFLSTVLESKKLQKSGSTKINLAAVIMAFAAGILLLSAPVGASDYSAQIKQLQDQNANSEAARKGLEDAAIPLKAKIADLQATIDGLNNLISTNQAQRDNLTSTIAALESQIAGQRQILKDSIRYAYINDNMSTLEVMASSKNLSDYVDKEQYQLAAQTKVKQSMDTIDKLQGQQRKQQKQIDQLLGDSKKMQAQVATQKQQEDQLLAQNQSQQDGLNQTISSNNSQITDLERKQAAENAAFLSSQSASGGSYTTLASPSDIMAVDGTAYPWANAPWPNNIPDPWGMYERQCVSYAAWAVAASGRHMPFWGGAGNANQWDDNARAAGIPVDGNPRSGDVAIKNSGTYGHAMYVDSVNSDGSINISQYNANWDGAYSTARIWPDGLVFIHF